MTYQELLSTIEWKNKRDIILRRDKMVCQNCNNKTYFKESKPGDVIKGALSFQMVDFLNKKDWMKNHYSITFQESNHTYMFREGIPKPVNVASFSSYKYYAPKDLLGLKVLFKEEKGKIIITCVANDSVVPFEWVLVKNLHVHHKYYQSGKMPWEYPNAALVTLCWVCHEELHENSTVLWLDEKGNRKGSLTNCKKCHGAGYLPHYSHVESGVCFSCFGKKFEEFTD